MTANMIPMRYILGIFIVLTLLPSCAPRKNATHVTVPGWARDAIWYQIFPERFRNGDRSNDPTREDAHIADGRDWAVSPWTSDWYALQPWERAHDARFYDNVFQRYYGGDLQGVVDELDYLSSLGVTAIYFNPVFEAVSLHKYDASSYHHIDDNFGPDPAGDKALVATETNDPSTWHWTSADKLFLNLLSEAHARGMHVIIDGVFNHTGTDFWAFRDVRKNQQASPYADWYDIVSWDDPSTPADEFDYKGWWGHKALPEFAESDSGFVPAVWRHLFDITRRWMDPNGDGDPSDGIDGWRLDVANEVSPIFWKEWRTEVKALNPDAYIVGEIWDDASHWLSGDQFDAVMNYRFARACVRFFIDTDDRSLDAEGFDDELATIRNDYPEETNYILQNLLDSHDTDRLLSMIRNPNRNFDDMNGLRANTAYDTRKPRSADVTVQQLMSLFQMTYIGAPMIYYGSEAGMWGADDPDDRKPMVWPDLSYQPEATSFDQKTYERPDTVSFDSTIFSWYQQIIAIRRSSEALRRGTMTTLVADDDIFAFQRKTGSDSVIVAFNRGAEEAVFRISVAGRWTDELTGAVHDLDGDIILPGRSALVLKAHTANTQ